MATPQKEPLRTVTAEERAALERVVHASSERVDRVRRATALLAVAQGQAYAQAARRAGFKSGTAVAELAIAPGRGREPAYDAAARAQIVAAAQRAPDRRADGTATWSLSRLERTLRRDGLPGVGASTIRQVLQEAGSSYQRTRTWCPTGTAERKRKSGVARVIDPQTELKRG